MKRYNTGTQIVRSSILETIDPGILTIRVDQEMTEHSTGKWVKYEDVKKTRYTARMVLDQSRDLHEEIRRLKAKLAMKQSGPVPQVGADGILKVRDVTECNCNNWYIGENGFRTPHFPGVECNCLEMTEDPKQPSWICPVHGYKKR